MDEWNVHPYMVLASDGDGDGAGTCAAAADVPECEVVVQARDDADLSPDGWGGGSPARSSAPSCSRASAAACGQRSRGVTVTRVGPAGVHADVSASLAVRKAAVLNPGEIAAATHATARPRHWSPLAIAVANG
ncbi:hypothetical protein Ahu01nite_091980 [Winogradskya humida]|uniref:Uncharacterized protein n=1 Tax=Winogradskya humida TaxID=113566 RepID=A0ABQ4A5H4_9ACTN|nr:hypothetical protein Ahu01nite_091980 [Actinoplanes humidus]